jgi:hypothetical protein
MGKSMFAFQIAMNVALSTAKPVFISSMEMSAQSVTDRWISSTSRVLLSRIRRREITEADAEKIIKSMDLSDRLTNVCLDQDSSAQLNQILSRAKDHARNHARIHGGDGQLALLVIDNVQIAEMGDDEKTADRINKFCKQAKQASKDLNVPIILLSQINRDSLKGTNKRPTMQAMHGGTGIRNNADFVWGLYRDEYYNPDTVDRDIAEVIQIKARESESNRVARLFFEGIYSTFKELGADCAPTRSKTEPQRSIAVSPAPGQITSEDLKPLPLTAEQLASIDYKNIELGCEVVTDSLSEDLQTIEEMISNGEIPPLDEVCVVTKIYSYLLAIPGHKPMIVTEVTLARESGSEMKVDLFNLRRFN